MIVHWSLVSFEPAWRVLEAGRACLQDSGRQAWGRYGVPTRGSSDSYSYRMANALVGNRQDEAVVEVTGFDFVARAERDLLLAVTGANCEVRINGHLARTWQPLAVEAKSVVEVRRLRDGLRCYLACNGTLEAPVLMDSVSPEPSLGFGTYLQVGQLVGIESQFSTFQHPYLQHPVLRPAVPLRKYRSPSIIDITPGPDSEQFETGLSVLTTTQYTVGPQSDEIGLQLEGVTPPRNARGEQLSRGVAVGAIEVTPAGHLIALLRGRMLTAGYPVVAVATRAAQSRLGQQRPGDSVLLRLVSVDEAIRTARAEQAAIDAVAKAVRTIGASLQLACLTSSDPSTTV